AGLFFSTCGVNNSVNFYTSGYLKSLPLVQEPHISKPDAFSAEGMPSNRFLGRVVTKHCGGIFGQNPHLLR
ncbi:MAG: hypothetical protein Q4A62_02915, partial [Eikenella sp.]|nr:hypothetical protein [Eikenella sp.]